MHKRSLFKFSMIIIYVIEFRHLRATCKYVITAGICTGSFICIIVSENNIAVIVDFVATFGDLQ